MKAAVKRKIMKICSHFHRKRSMTHRSKVSGKRMEFVSETEHGKPNQPPVFSVDTVSSKLKSALLRGAGLGFKSGRATASVNIADWLLTHPELSFNERKKK